MEHNPEGTEVDGFQFRFLIRCYISELTTGMRMCQVPLSSVAPRYGVTTKNKRKALAQLLANYEATMGEAYEDPRLATIYA